MFKKQQKKCNVKTKKIKSFLGKYIIKNDMQHMTTMYLKKYKETYIDPGLF